MTLHRQQHPVEAEEHDHDGEHDPDDPERDDHGH
jgi:hypothetical protein